MSDSIPVLTTPSIPAGKHTVNADGERYFVFAKFLNKDTFSEVRSCLSYEQAVQTANFWDERVDTVMLTYRLPMDYLSVGMRKFDELAEQIRNAP